MDEAIQLTVTMILNYNEIELFRLLVQSVREYAIFLIDPDGFVVSWNVGAERIKGYSRSEIIGENFSIFYPEQARQKEWPSYGLKMAQEKGSYEEEGWRIRKDGSRFWANVVITPISEDGVLLGFAKVTRDLTERKTADESLSDYARQLEEANSVKAKFLSMVSHEVRTPMSGIIGMSELLTMSPLDVQSAELAKHIFDSSKRLLRILNDVIDFNKLGAGKLRIEQVPFSVRAVVGDAIQSIGPEASKKKLTITSSVTGDIPERVFGDELRLSQVLLNIAHNAVKFTSSGFVRIDVHVLEKLPDYITVKFSIVDTGIGIATESQKHVFEPFEQAESGTQRTYGGTGLGLSISKTLVELMSGTIGFHSQKDQGATFWFTLPLATKEQ